MVKLDVLRYMFRVKIFSQAGKPTFVHENLLYTKVLLHLYVLASHVEQGWRICYKTAADINTVY